MAYAPCRPVLIFIAVCHYAFSRQQGVLVEHWPEVCKGKGMSSLPIYSWH